VSGDSIILAPPYVATREELAEIATRFAAAARAVLEGDLPGR
jgi:adenosylmethionine-8-amino-7-oxononanoate aminotransferase